MNSNGAKSKQSATKFQTTVTNGAPLATLFVHKLTASTLLPFPQRKTKRLILDLPRGCWKHRVCQTNWLFVDAERLAKESPVSRRRRRSVTRAGSGGRTNGQPYGSWRS